MIRRSCQIFAALLLWGLLCLLSGCGAQTYTVTFETDGGTVLSGSTVQTVEAGESAVPPQVEYGRHTLTWEGDYTNVTEDRCVTAHWEKIPMEADEVSAYVRERTVTVTTETITGVTVTGTGFFIADGGILLTEYHAIDMAETVSVTLSDGTVCAVEEIVGYSPAKNLAVLQADTEGNGYLARSNAPAAEGTEIFVFTGDGVAEGAVAADDREMSGIPCLEMSVTVPGTCRGGPVVDCYGDFVGILTAPYGEQEELELAICAGTVEEVALDKHMTVKEFRAWYEEETSHCYSPKGENTYYYSLVETYQQVTGAECVCSVSGAEAGSGYYDCCDYYVYDFDMAGCRQYTAYLEGCGFAWQGEKRFTEGTSSYYYSEKDGILVDLFLTEEEAELWVFVTR